MSSKYKKGNATIGLSGKFDIWCLNDIFGHQEGSTFFEGLVDSSNEEEFESKLAMLKDQWEEKENIHGTKTGFRGEIHQFSYIRTKQLTERGTIKDLPSPNPTSIAVAIPFFLKLEKYGIHCRSI